jgi:GntR family transcriptional regulator
MKIQIDFRSGIPIYMQIVEQVEHLIAAGDLEVGEQLPTVRQLAQELRVNFNTVARSYRMLDEAGLISTQHGRGTYILEKPSLALQSSLRNKELFVLVRRLLREAEAMGCPADVVETVFNEQLERWRQGDLDGKDA